jgi:hypothetical protein
MFFRISEVTKKISYRIVSPELQAVGLGGDSYEIGAMNADD